MVNINKLRGKMREYNITQEDLAKVLNLTRRTVSNRIMKGIIKTNEIDIIIRYMNLNRDEAINIFFEQKVS